MVDYSGKRVLDVICAAFGLAASAPLIAVAAALIRLETTGPALFRQQRLGRNETRFVIYKLRTMHVDTIQAGTHLVPLAQVTRVGRVLRKLKIDELPQLVNVLRGEMSLVGPRPCLTSQRELIEARRRLGVFAVRPGITGLAQVMGFDMSQPAKLAALDATYIADASFTNDLRFLLATVLWKWQGRDVD